MWVFAKKKSVKIQWSFKTGL